MIECFIFVNLLNMGINLQEGANLTTEDIGKRLADFLADLATATGEPERVRLGPRERVGGSMMLDQQVVTQHLEARLPWVYRIVDESEPGSFILRYSRFTYGWITGVLHDLTQFSPIEMEIFRLFRLSKGSMASLYPAHGYQSSVIAKLLSNII